jgi:predicted N-acetyltransferase YhbS
LSLIAKKSGLVIGTVRLWPVAVGGGARALLLGPLAVDPDEQGEGVGSGLMQAVLERATALGHHGIILVGNPRYYRKFGFTAGAARDVRIPGQADQHRVLGCELAPGGLADAIGELTVPTGLAAVRLSPGSGSRRSIRDLRAKDALRAAA